MAVSQEKFYLSGREIRQRGPLNVTADQKWTYSEMAQIGFGGLHAMDSALTGPAAAGGFIQRHMLQHVLPGLIRTATRIRILDEITGVMTAGEWHHEEIVLNVATPSAKVELYGDHTNIPLASYENDIERRGIVRYEQGFQVGKLEEARQSAAGFEAAAEKCNAATESLEMSRERTGYFGFNSAETRVFGLLNDPNLPAYETAKKPWLQSTFAEVTGDMNTLFDRLEKSSGGASRTAIR
ncbi:phage protein [Xenorhabdus vietnamensis]|uniref:Phage protein n=1 Tax=Xenorhabdus vietnamensis TaxID=351656 RepID=A0A1Y2S7G4_9GAMM|nr:major capsid family protein [Xenorhabdus vietnamensis]OTA14604.1 phage protein [Xenorhabdus vietnamensis]